MASYFTNKVFENIWIQPSSGDRVLSVLHFLQTFNFLREKVVNKNDSMKEDYLGPRFKIEISQYLKIPMPSHFLPDEDELLDKVLML